MPKVKRLSFKGMCEYQGEAVQAVAEPGDGTLVVRGVPRALVIRCPDGCGETITVNLDPRSGKAWRLYETRGKFTLYPSVWRETGCRAHFILWRDEILWCDWDDSPSWHDDNLRAAILNILPSNDETPVHFEEIAAKLKAVPWDVFWISSALTKQGLAVSFEKGSLFKKSRKHTPHGGPQ